MRRGSTVGGAVIAVMLGVVTAALGLPIWVFLVVLLLPFALWWVQWVRPQGPVLCHMCERDIHPHDYYDGRCMAGYCQCDATIDTPAGGKS